MEQPTRITILSGYNRDFTVLVESLVGKVAVQDGLCYDEMLGHVARLLCPTFDDGSPVRHLGRPLFLDAPAIATAEKCREIAKR